MNVVFFDIRFKLNLSVGRTGFYRFAMLVAMLVIVGGGQMTAYADTVVSNIAVGTTPVGVAVTPNGASVYVSNNGSNTVSVINTSTNAVSTVSDPSGYLTGGGLQDLAVSPDGSRVYVACSSTNTIAVINTSTNTAVLSIGVGSFPIDVAFNPAGTKAYVTNSIGQTVYEINVNAGNMLLDARNGSFSVSLPERAIGLVVVHISSKDRVYVGCSGAFSSSVEAFNTDGTNSVSISMSGSPYFLDALSNGSKVFVSRFTSNQISTITTSSDTITDTDSTSSGSPMGVAVSVTPTGTRVFVACFGATGLGTYVATRYEVSSGNILTQLTVQTRPRGAAANAAGTRVYITNTSSNTVSVINTTI